MAPKAKSEPQAIPAEKKHIVGLPIQVVGPIDVGRLIRELEAIDNAILEGKLRTGGGEYEKLKTSQLMSATLDMNKLDILNEEDRRMLANLLNTVRDQAPVLHISFSADPTMVFIEKLMTWLRREIHPVVLLTIGLQPNIGAGCIVRSTNKQFDFSLRKDFLKKRELLHKYLAAKEPIA